MYFDRMRRKNTTLLATLFMLAVSQTACVSAIVKNKLAENGIFLTKPILKPISNNLNKEIWFVEMHHVGYPQFYENTIGVIDSMQALGYTVLHEGIRGIPNDSIATIQYRKKLYYLLGGSDGRAVDSAGNLKFEQLNRFKGVKKLFDGMVSQPRNMGYKEDKDVQVDIRIDSLIHAYEAKYGEVILSDCYKKSPIDSVSKCPANPISGERQNDIAQTFRNPFIADFIRRHPAQKILLVYGKAHYNGLAYLLK